MKIIQMKSDVAVIGGGPGGIPAALAAARHGAKVILAERNGHVGGNAVMGLPLLGYLDQNGTRIIGGIAQEFVDDLMKTGDCFGHQRCPMHNSITLVHPERLKLNMLKKLRDAGVQLLLHAELADAVVENGRITKAVMIGKATRVEIEAKVFIDATGDGDLAQLCGATPEKGIDGVVQPPTVMFSLTGFHHEGFFDFLEAHPENMRQLDSVMVSKGYDTRLWRSTPSYVFVGMQAYLRELREKLDCPVLRENIIYINSTLPGKIFVNTVRVPGCDGSDLLSLTNGEIEGQMQIPGIVDMLKNHVPGFERCELDNISPAIGIRESNRYHGLKRLTLQNVLNGDVPEDTIALGGYKVDIHNGRGEGTVLMEVKKPYGIPMGCVVSSEVDGLLLSGRCISMDSEALASERVMPICMAVGQGAGTLAALAVGGGKSPAEMDARPVCDALQKDGAILRA